MARLDDDGLFSTDPGVRRLARALYDGIRHLPILSSHRHTDPRVFAENVAFPDPSRLLLTPDPAVFRMLHSQGIPLGTLGVGPAFAAAEADTFRGQMLTEMARMRLDEGLVRQIHRLTWRNPSDAELARFGRDTGHDARRHRTDPKAYWLGRCGPGPVRRRVKVGTSSYQVRAKLW